MCLRAPVSCSHSYTPFRNGGLSNHFTMLWCHGISYIPFSFLSLNLGSSILRPTLGPFFPFYCRKGCLNSHSGFVYWKVLSVPNCNLHSSVSLLRRLGFIKQNLNLLCAGGKSS